MWLKLLALRLIGVNAAVFYLTGVFGRVEQVKAGEDAPKTVKAAAAASLFLWLAVIVLGRYIQKFDGTIK